MNLGVERRALVLRGSKQLEARDSRTTHQPTKLPQLVVVQGRDASEIGVASVLG